ncbi:MAG: 1-deoxy-D-xylulose-5-phosphate synthase [Spirochaetaceae bacterium]|nr:1-deoxy-D-xylulose-5-phosphate synthase [Spirochaetaceae bacterium]
MIFNGWRLKKARCRRSPNATIKSPGAYVQNGSPHTDASETSIGADVKKVKRAKNTPAPAESPSVIAVIGDGALTGGMAYEALSCAPHLGLPLIIVLNDNRMSISPNVGGLSRHLSRLSMRTRYQTFRTAFDSMTLKIPFVGKSVFNVVQRLKRAVKAVFYQDNFFVELGFEYVGPIDGHNLKELTETFADVRKQTAVQRRLSSPVVVHVITQKGKGYPPAESEPDIFHGVPPFSPEDGTVPAGGESWTRIFGDALIEAARKDSRVCAITAAMEKGTGLSAFHAEFPARFFDVGIAEAHAVTFAAALAARGLRPVAAIYSTFLQRAVDSVIHDTAPAGLPVIFAVDRAGFVAGDGETHQGLFDISILRSVPGMVIMEPAFAGELPLMLNWALARNRPCAIRYPKAPPPSTENIAEAIPTLTEGRGVLFEFMGGEVSPLATAALTARLPLPPSPRGLCPLKPPSVLLAFTGSLYDEALKAAWTLADEGIFCALYNFRFLAPIDEDYLLGLLRDYELVVVAEEGAQNGGIGECVLALAARGGIGGKLITLNAGNAYYAQGTRQELLRRAGLDAEAIAAAVRSNAGAFSVSLN